jgi:hypothetical protein
VFRSGAVADPFLGKNGIVGMKCTALRRFRFEGGGADDL